MRKEIGSGVLAAMLAITGPVVAELNSSNAIVQKGEMPSQREIDLVDQKEAELVNQRFTEFLAGEGEYSEYNVRRKLIPAGHYRDLGYRGIGFNYYFMVQAILLHCEDGENGQYLALGVKNEKGKQEIIVVEYPTVLLEKGESGFGVGVLDNGGANTKIVNTEKEAKEILNGRTGKLLIGCFVFDNIPKKYFDEKEINNTFIFRYLESKKSINLDFASDLLFPSKKDMIESDKEMVNRTKGIKSKVTGVTSLSEMLEKIKNQEEFPVMNTYQYNLNEK